TKSASDGSRRQPQHDGENQQGPQEPRPWTTGKGAIAQAHRSPGGFTGRERWDRERTPALFAAAAASKEVPPLRVAEQEVDAERVGDFVSQSVSAFAIGPHLSKATGGKSFNFCTSIVVVLVVAQPVDGGTSQSEGHQDGEPHEQEKPPMEACSDVPSHAMP